MYLLQIWFNLSGPATGGAIYDSYAMCKFTWIDFIRESVPDETTLYKFRYLLEVNGPNKLFYDTVNYSSIDYHINRRLGRSHIYLEKQLNGNNILRTASPLRAARWNIHFKS